MLTGVAAMLGAFFILDDPIFNGLAISLILEYFVSTTLRWSSSRSSTTWPTAIACRRITGGALSVSDSSPQTAYEQSHDLMASCSFVAGTFILLSLALGILAARFLLTSGGFQVFTAFVGANLL